MRALVTGVAGFIGSRLADRLAGDGWTVVGVDNLVPYYDLEQKRRNLDGLPEGVDVLEADLRTADLEDLLAGVDVVFHQAGQPGVRASWDQFDSYVDHNILVTKRLLETARETRPSRFVFASSSSVYGDATAFPTREDTLPRPQSPYGVTKLAAEHLCGVYARNWAVPTVSLRYFTVFGPGQRPDMAMHRLIEAALGGTSFPLYGTGEQIRDFTFVGDVVNANLAAATADVAPGTVVNIAGGGAASMNEVIAMVERLTGESLHVDHQARQAGDVERTGGAIEAAERILGWKPSTSVEEGLERQVRWHRARGRAGVVAD